MSFFEDTFYGPGFALRVVSVRRTVNREPVHAVISSVALRQTAAAAAIVSMVAVGGPSPSSSETASLSAWPTGLDGGRDRFTSIHGFEP